MSVTERINEIQQSLTEQAKKESVVYEAEAKRLRLENEAKAAAQEKYLSSQYKKILQETHIGELLTEIEKNFLEGRYKNHRISTKRDVYAKDKVCFQLAWDFEPSQLRENYVVGDHFKSIDVTIHLDDESITINSHEIQSNVWRSDTNIISDTLAEAYISPNTHIYIGPMYETGWS